MNQAPTECPPYSRQRLVEIPRIARDQHRHWQQTLLQGANRREVLTVAPPTTIAYPMLPRDNQGNLIAAAHRAAPAPHRVVYMTPAQVAAGTTRRNPIRPPPPDLIAPTYLAPIPAAPYAVGNPLVGAYNPRQHHRQLGHQANPIGIQLHNHPNISVVHRPLAPRPPRGAPTYYPDWHA